VLHSTVITKACLKKRLLDEYLRGPIWSEQREYMHQLIYLSQATRPLSVKALTCLVEQAWEANAQQNLTGALVYSNKRFIQLLEGEQAALEAAYTRISQDPRHQHLCKIAHHSIASRSFTEWPLAFQTLSPAQFAHLAGCLAPDKSTQHFPVYGSAATLFVEAMRTLVQAPATN
jgi:hypothetical protein